ncbi:hypothetical protein MHIB_23270 [Mycolicibacter hiberniae]|uniref:Uncharacterized protein n=1 Tax=Mycolicibacter hiberniae TaxID=29314 RepID=A0A7I7X237_9MYCO|nr:hypothetical protein MHIB_23270 [Mycolicibacter hiberniae]
MNIDTLRELAEQHGWTVEQHPDGFRADKGPWSWEVRNDPPGAFPKADGKPAEVFATLTDHTHLDGQRSLAVDAKVYETFSDVAALLAR